ncbi:hypothetical protein Hanom_Chr10g00962891 [Helianthus anomalus]
MFMYFEVYKRYFFRHFGLSFVYSNRNMSNYQKLNYNNTFFCLSFIFYFRVK